MAARSTPKTATPAPPIIDAVAIRQQGFTLLTPIKLDFQDLISRRVGGVPALETDEDNLEADAILGRIRQFRAEWDAKFVPLTNPIKEIEAQLKQQKKAISNLHAELDTPLATMELQVKALMRDFALAKERRQLEAQRVEAEATRKRQQEIDAARAREEAAKTPQMRAKLAQKRADLEEQLEEAVEEEREERIDVLKPTASVVRHSEEPTIRDLKAFLMAAQDYEPEAGVYRMGVPPLSLVTVLLTEMKKIYKSTPGIVKSWPGVVIEKDVSIAGRRG